MTEEFQNQLLKFADSELSPEEESCVLLECEQRPELWKDLALALVAERRLTDAMAGFEDCEFASNVSQTESACEVESRRATESSGATTSKWSSAGKLLALSLALLLAFAAGNYQPSVDPNQMPANQVTAGKPERSLPNQEDQRQRPAPQQQPGFASPSSKTLLANSMPSELSADANQQTDQAVNPWTVVSKPVISDEDRDIFFEAGLDVEEQNTVYIVSDSDGGRWAIPWKAVNVRYSPNQ